METSRIVWWWRHIAEVQPIAEQSASDIFEQRRIKFYIYFDLSLVFSNGKKSTEMLVSALRSLLGFASKIRFQIFPDFNPF